MSVPSPSPARPWSCFFLILVTSLVWAPPAGAEMAIALNSGDDSISLIDTQTYQEVARTPIGKEPHHLMATPDDRYLIVANAAGNELVFLDPVSGKTSLLFGGLLPQLKQEQPPDAVRWSVCLT